ncbi:hypothetical protein FN846DRAFT_890185 [Sphaerosporella brunnea]|uniref:AMP-activated protein kinase glycogen-binding domain-containing protein n=1 Tax=Sphaerosporella brunnea TaxID=1250544 RepID=A0A5J5EXA8_9PEZI|nr:hypothetical protein FN846DRAFT_890185 [Sphaerosporella brunnea]
MSGYYTFKWDLPANEVYVTGTFDGWSRSTKLDKAGAEFIKKVELPKENILYKFVVDGNWVTDPNAPIETDSSGAQNSILSADRIEAPKEPELEHEQVMEQAAINTVAPESTTAALAAAVPKESDVTSEALNISSAAPESTTAALAGEVPLETATPGNDGGFPTAPTVEESEPTPAPQKEEDQILSVNPLPASDTAENPITLAPGEPVPKDIGTQSITSNVKLDKESYEAGATNYPVGSIVLPEVATLAAQREAEGSGILDIPPITNNMIPESSLPIVSAAEAEAHVPEIIKESQELAGEPAEASAVLEIVELKEEVEVELKSEVPIIPPIAEGNNVSTQAVEDTELTSAAAAGVTAKTPEQPVAQVPSVVRDSIAEDRSPAEATASRASVEAKKLVENELKHEVVEIAPISEATSPVAAAEESAAKITEQTAPVVTDGVTSETLAAREITLNAVPKPVKESVEAGVTAEAASEPVAVVQKAAVEEQLKESIKPTEPVKTAEAPPKTSIEGKPKKSSEGSESSDSSPKKTKRRSFFGALKEKLHFGRK